MRNAMKRNIQCIEIQKYGPERQNVIYYPFVSSEHDKEIPSCARIAIGDIDPMTGEPIVDIHLFREIYSVINSQAHTNLRVNRPFFTTREQEERRKMGEAFAEEFERAYGYRPSRDDMKYYLAEKWPVEHMLHYDDQNHHGEEYEQNCDIRLADPASLSAAPGEVSEETEMMREFEKTLQGIERDIYEVMLYSTGGGAEKPRMNYVMKKWGKSNPSEITRIRKKVEAKLIRFVQEWEENS